MTIPVYSCTCYNAHLYKAATLPKQPCQSPPIDILG